MQKGRALVTGTSHPAATIVSWIRLRQAQHDLISSGRVFPGRFFGAKHLVQAGERDDGIVVATMTAERPPALIVKADAE